VRNIPANAGTPNGQTKVAGFLLEQLGGLANSPAMNPILCRGACLGGALVACAALSAPGPGLNRPLPKPLSHHPGNIFLAGEEVSVPLPARPEGPWRLVDYEDRLLMEVAPAEGTARLGLLPEGFYRLRPAQGTNTLWVSLGVLAPLKAPTPATSPIGLDVAMAWFYPPEKMDAVANLCALAGVNWVRDRLSWAEMERKRGQWADTNRYDASALAQSKAGLRVLQVTHISPAWANPETKRFPLDLRDAFRFWQAMARRWRGQVEAFEPWNEADIPMFGGHTGAEMAALQKAAWFGLKAGNPDAIACLNVFAHHNPAQLADLEANRAWPYFDTYNLHHYEPFDHYPKLYADHRAVSAGRPLWVSECAVPVKWAGDDRLKEPTDADLRVQAERVVRTFACSLHEGSTATFYFLLPHYVEGQVQFGILRPDLTPRPAYVALAAVGRWLADARPLGRLRSTNAALRGFVFRARPDGQPRDVLVAWTTNGYADLRLPVAPETVSDHLGRNQSAEQTLRLTTAPVFARLEEGVARRLELEAPPSAPAFAQGEPSPVVLQALWPADRLSLKESAYRISSEKPERIPVFLYNFSAQAMRGTLRVTVPEGWKASLEGEVALAPQERQETALVVDARGGLSRPVDTVRVTGTFPGGQETVLSLRLMPEPSKPGPHSGQAIPGANDPARWRAMVSEGGKCRIARDGASVTVEAEPAGTDRWVYPALALDAAERPSAKMRALAVTLTWLEGAGQCRAIFDEANGSSYVADLAPLPKRGEAIETLALLQGATHGAEWSKPDANGRLDPDQITSLKIGCNTKDSRVKFTIQALRWIEW
jgi:hypothetical protein